MVHRSVACLTLLSVVLLQPIRVFAQPPLQASVTSEDDERGVDVVAALGDSLKLLMLEHGTRVAFQPKTRRELGGPFWRDYRRSIRWPSQWEDTDSWLVNYLGHPIHGAAAGYLWLDHDSGAPVQLLLSRRYWATRGQAAAWSAVYSLQFEIGPLSEASIGNVGLRRETTGWVDHVVTPLGAFGLIVAEDALDRYVVQFAERHIRPAPLRAVLRVVFNPGRALSNTASGRLPWSRSGRPIGWR